MFQTEKSPIEIKSNIFMQQLARLLGTGWYVRSRNTSAPPRREKGGLTQLFGNESKIA
jgi:hypothetical protein